MKTVLEFHEVASIFPLMEGEDFEAFKEDIGKNGLREPIWTYKGKIIDGRNRYRACKAASVEPEFREWDGRGDIAALVMSLNVHRRHLSQSQRSMAAARLVPYFEQHAKERQATSTGGANPQPKKKLTEENGHHFNGNGSVSQLPANLPEAGHGESREKAATLQNVSPRSVESASKVLKNGVPELVKAVDAGSVKVSTAAAISTLPKKEQAAVVAEGPRAIKQKAKEVKENRRPTKDPLSVVIDDLMKTLASLDAPKGQFSEGWGGFDHVIRSRDKKARVVIRHEIEHIVERLQGWLEIINQVEQEAT